MWYDYSMSTQLDEGAPSRRVTSTSTPVKGSSEFQELQETATDLDPDIWGELGSSFASLQSRLTWDPSLSPEGLMTDSTVILKKANAVLHNEQLDGASVTLLQLNLFNGLLKVALDHLAKLPPADFERLLNSQTVVVFEASVATLSRYANGYVSKDYARVYAGMEALLTHRVRWNMCREPGVTIQSNTHLISQYNLVKRAYGPDRRERTETVQWAWMPDIFRLLFNPVSYTPLNLNFTTQFRSRYVLTLYENCVRYINTGLTRAESIEFWRAIIVGDFEKYKEAREFIRLLAGCIEEINAYTPCAIEIEMLIKRGQFNRIKTIQFSVQKKKQSSFEFYVPLGMDPAFYAKLRQWKIPSKDIKNLCDLHDILYLEDCMKIVLSRMATTQIDHLGKYYQKVLVSRKSSEAYLRYHEKASDTKFKQVQSRSAAQASGADGTSVSKDLFPEQTVSRVVDWFRSLSEEGQAAVLADASKTLKDSIERRGLDNQGVRKMFYHWIVSKGLGPVTGQGPETKKP